MKELLSHLNLGELCTLMGFVLVFLAFAAALADRRK